HELAEGFALFVSVDVLYGRVLASVVLGEYAQAVLHVLGDLIRLDIGGRHLRVTGGRGSVEERRILRPPAEVLEPHDGGAAAYDAENVDADGKGRISVNPDLDLCIRVGVVADEGMPGDGEAFGFDSADLLQSRDRLGLAAVFAEAAEDA